MYSRGERVRSAHGETRLNERSKTAFSGDNADRGPKGAVATATAFAAELLFAGVDHVGPAFGSAAHGGLAHGQAGVNDSGNPKTEGEEGIDEDTPPRSANGNRERRTQDGQTIKHN